MEIYTNRWCVRNAVVTFFFLDFLWGGVYKAGIEISRVFRKRLPRGWPISILVCVGFPETNQNRDKPASVRTAPGTFLFIFSACLRVFAYLSYPLCLFSLRVFIRPMIDRGRRVLEGGRYVRVLALRTHWLLMFSFYLPAKKGE